MIGHQHYRLTGRARTTEGTAGRPCRRGSGAGRPPLAAPAPPWRPGAPLPPLAALAWRRRRWPPPLAAAGRRWPPLAVAGRRWPSRAAPHRHDWRSHRAPGCAGETARQAGRAWGGFLSGPPAPFQRLSAGEAVTRLTALLDDLGFDPELGRPEPGQSGSGQSGSGQPGPDAVIRLRHCPFLELAEEYGDLVCRIHLGLMQGALAELRAPVTAAVLEPFAEPGACLARLEPATVA